MKTITTNFKTVGCILLAVLFAITVVSKPAVSTLSNFNELGKILLDADQQVEKLVAADPQNKQQFLARAEAEFKILQKEITPLLQEISDERLNQCISGIDLHDYLGTAEQLGRCHDDIKQAIDQEQNALQKLNAHKKDLEKRLLIEEQILTDDDATEEQKEYAQEKKQELEADLNQVEQQIEKHETKLSKMGKALRLIGLILEVAGVVAVLSGYPAAGAAMFAAGALLSNVGNGMEIVDSVNRSVDKGNDVDGESGGHGELGQNTDGAGLANEAAQAELLSKYKDNGFELLPGHANDGVNIVAKGEVYLFLRAGSVLFEIDWKTIKPLQGQALPKDIYPNTFLLVNSGHKYAKFSYQSVEYVVTEGKQGWVVGNAAQFKEPQGS